MKATFLALQMLFRRFVPMALLLGSLLAAAQEKTYRVALIAQSPPLSFTDSTGKFTGFNVEMATELCVTMKVRCVQHPLPIDKIVDMAAADQVDFAVVGFVPTPERKARVLFSKAYYQSMSVWLANPSITAGNSRSSVAVIKGSAQASHAQSMGWKTTEAESNKEIKSLLASGVADATVLPMLNAWSLAQESVLQPLGLKSTVLRGPLITGSLHMVINPKQSELVERINAALDQIKRDGRFDRINTLFVPFSLL
jgi:polar amino acid transport system substrate-binding protein